MRHLRYKDGHAGLLVGEIQSEMHLVLLTIESVEIVFYLFFRNGKLLELPLYTHEKYVLYPIDILVEVDDVALIDGDEVGDIGDDAWSVGAMQQNYSSSFHITF